MKSLSRSEFESLISVKKPKIITQNREMICLTENQAMDWFDSTIEVSKTGFVFEATCSTLIGYSDECGMDFGTWHKIGGQQ